TSSTSCHTPYILRKKFALTPTAYKYLDIGISVGLISYVKIVIGDNRGNRIILPSLRCFRYLERGHVQQRCSPTMADRHFCCFNCEQPGHSSSGCRAKASCSLCKERGLASGHRPGSGACRPVEAACSAPNLERAARRAEEEEQAIRSPTVPMEEVGGAAASDSSLDGPDPKRGRVQGVTGISVGAHGCIPGALSRVILEPLPSTSRSSAVAGPVSSATSSGVVDLAASRATSSGGTVQAPLPQRACFMRSAAASQAAAAGSSVTGGRGNGGCAMEVVDEDL
ncbi:hypothetical protein ALC60_12137, partial [Trachymyrmex zeteki]